MFMHNINSTLMSRLKGLKDHLLAGYNCGDRMSSSSKGEERENIIKELIQPAIPSYYRTAKGDITDKYGSSSGQLDIVIENSLLPCLPSPAGDGPRLYLAEGVAAVIEVKSSLKDEWTDAKRP
ncbi:MAG TPA: DUF6602 domain-containing protein [Fimbriiglobus sp.]|jgi:hypothetical protein